MLLHLSDCSHICTNFIHDDDGYLTVYVITHVIYLSQNCYKLIIPTKRYRLHYHWQTVLNLFFTCDQFISYSFGSCVKKSAFLSRDESLIKIYIFPIHSTAPTLMHQTTKISNLPPALRWITSCPGNWYFIWPKSKTNWSIMWLFQLPKVKWSKTDFWSTLPYSISCIFMKPYDFLRSDCGQCFDKRTTNHLFHLFILHKYFLGSTTSSKKWNVMSMFLSRQLPSLFPASLIQLCTSL